MQHSNIKHSTIQPPDHITQSPAIEAISQWRDYLGLCKLKVVAVMLLTALVGMCLAVPELPAFSTLFWGLSGIGLASCSAAAVNHVVDSHIDEKMARTRHRPLPQGKITHQQALLFAAIIGVIGITALVIFINPLTAWLTLASLIGYAVVYSMWLKRATPQNIVIGGVAGAAPPLLGWVAVTGSLDPNSLLLMLIIFAWTPPHFWALCIARKADYQKAGIPMLPVTHGEAFTKLQIILYTLLMVATTAFPYLTQMSGEFYLIGVVALNLRFMQWAWKVYNSDDKQVAMGMFRYSITYIMMLFVVLLIDHYYAFFS
ncbi:heme o synthase [Neptunomonas qingdaonensis]|uniref:Protoheme IX farnesyltransferase n=1 Tax=Neptunomonas qingdaonensis TaxID=1045558 RepID=A0A1I2M292_9GAMM|nr:heme o synthase [Neptunomonas qingdaonensis]SFF85682.1 protoheme IX farnesyltransferase [Neptunomonas qingdaonensis]